MRLVELIATIGAAQGALLLLLILLRFRHAKNLALVLLLLTFSLRLGTTPSWNPETLLAYRWFLPLTGGVPLVFGPLVWWYVRELRCDSPAAPRLLPLHFLPFAVETLLLVVVVYSMTANAYEEFVGEVFSSRPPVWMTVRNVVKIVSGTVYAILAIRITVRSRGTSSQVLPGRRLWMIAIVAAPLLSLACFGVAAFWPDAALSVIGYDASIFLVPSVTMALTLYTLSMLVLLEPKALSYGQMEASGAAQTPNSAQSHPFCISAAEREWLLGRIQEQLDSEAVLDSSFSLRVLSETLHQHPNRVSYVINREFACSLPRLINKVRVDYFVRRLSEGALLDQTILELAFEAGFPSKSTFNRVFKEQLGVTPSEYLQSIDERSDVATRELSFPPLPR